MDSQDCSILMKVIDVTSSYARIAKPSYDEELALYELLELDADGENDIELDGTTVIVIVMVIK